MKATKTTDTWTSKDTFNTVKSKSLADCDNQTITIAAIAIGNDISNEDGRTVEAGYIRSADGQMFNTISKTALQQLDALIDMMEEGEEFTVKICRQKCKNDKKREFVYFDML